MVENPKCLQRLSKKEYLNRLGTNQAVKKKTTCVAEETYFGGVRGSFQKKKEYFEVTVVPERSSKLRGCFGSFGKYYNIRTSLNIFIDADQRLAADNCPADLRPLSFFTVGIYKPVAHLSYYGARRPTAYFTKNNDIDTNWKITQQYPRTSILNGEFSKRFFHPPPTQPLAIFVCDHRKKKGWSVQFWTKKSYGILDTQLTLSCLISLFSNLFLFFLKPLLFWRGTNFGA